MDGECNGEPMGIVDTFAGDPAHVEEIVEVFMKDSYFEEKRRNKNQ